MTYVYLFGEREVRNLKILMEQGVGVVVVSTLGRQATCIGSPATHTVYAVELQGIEMVLTQIYKSIGPATQCPDQTHIGIISQTTKWQYRHVQPLEGHLVSTSYTRSPSWLLNYGDMGGTYNCSGSLAMRAYMAMNVLMPLLRMPLASQPVTTQRSQSSWLAPDEFFI